MPSLLRARMPQRAVTADIGTLSRASALSSVVTEAWPHKPYTFRALRKTFGAMWVRCDVCRRYAPLSIRGLQEIDYRSKTFSCSECGSEGLPRSD